VAKETQPFHEIPEMSEGIALYANKTPAQASVSDERLCPENAG
jgi:hypothetical protein